MPPPIARAQTLEPSSEFFVSMPAQAFYAARRVPGRRKGVSGAGSGPLDYRRGDICVAVETGRLALVDEKKGQRKRGRAAVVGDGGAAGGKSGRKRDVGTALRSIFQDTVSEGVPQSLQDLLSKLD